VDTLDVTVLLGGPSAEREVSLASGAAIADALERVGHRVARADIDPGDATALDREGVEVVFIALHGDFGESGDVQQLCEQRRLAYTGSGPAASALALDKDAAKAAFRRAGLATPHWAVLQAPGAEDPAGAADRAPDLLDDAALPVVVKPVDGGSSVDVTIARTAAQRDGAAAALIERYGRALVERFVPGRELTVGILGDRALPLLEIVPARAFYDYTAKYSDDAGTRYVFDHGLDATTVERARAAALAAHRALGCRDFSRVDFVLDAAGVPQVLEVNTIPGFTSHSLLPKAAARAGISFEVLVDRLLRMAAARRSGR